MKALDEIVNYYYVGLLPNLAGTINTCIAIKAISEEDWGRFAINTLQQ